MMQSKRSVTQRIRKKSWFPLLVGIIIAIVIIFKIAFSDVNSIVTVFVPVYADAIDKPTETESIPIKTLEYDYDFAEQFVDLNNLNIKFKEDFFNKMYNYAINQVNNYSINILLIGASHGGSDGLQSYLSQKYPQNQHNNNNPHIFNVVMMEPAHMAFKDLDSWTQQHNILYNTSSLYLLNAAFNDKYNIDDTLIFYDWSDKFIHDFPKEPLYIKYQQGSFVKKHLIKTFKKVKKGHQYRDEYINEYVVPSYCLQTIVNNYFLNRNLNNINIVFIDAQGYEYNIVKAILSDNSFVANLINFELDMNQTQHEELVELFKQRNYTCWCPWHEGCCQDCKCAPNQNNY